MGPSPGPGDMPPHIADPGAQMFVRYDQDLTPFFERVRAEKRSQRSEQRRRWREGWANLLSHLRLRA